MLLTQEITLDSRRRSSIGLFLTALVSASTTSAQSRSHFPTKPVRLIVPYAVGGGADTVSRIIAGPVGERLGQPLVIENRGGAGGSIGAALAAQAEADGYTVFFDALGHVINPLLLRDLSFSYERAFTPISLLGTHTIIVVASPTHRYRSLPELFDALRAQSGALSYGTPGTGSGPHLAAESLLKRVGARANHIAYRGAGPALQDVMAGSIPFAVATASAAVPLVREGKILGLGVLSRERLSSLPNVPTATESAVPGFIFDEWSGLFVPTGTPEAAIMRLSAAVQDTMSLPAIRERFASLGTVPIGSTPSEFATFIAAQRKLIAQVVEDAGLKAK